MVVTTAKASGSAKRTALEALLDLEANPVVLVEGLGVETDEEARVFAQLDPPALLLHEAEHVDGAHNPVHERCGQRVVRVFEEIVAVVSNATIEAAVRGLPVDGLVVVPTSEIGRDLSDI